MKATKTASSQTRMLPPLQHLTLDDWARICESAERRYVAIQDGTLINGDDKRDDSGR